jgi:hypothetical protein
MKQLTIIIILFSVLINPLWAQEEEEKHLRDSVDVTSKVFLYEQDKKAMDSLNLVVMTVGNMYMFDESIVQSFRLDLLVQKHIALNELNQFVPGYRVQIAQRGTSNPIYDLQSQFITDFPEEEHHAYVRYIKPYYRLRVGNYIGMHGHWEAKVKANAIKKDYPTAFAVRDKISLQELIKEKE